MPLTTTLALKEWAVAVDALTQGQTIVLLRKGGIREVGDRFSVTRGRVWLYPTYEHQQPDLLKAKYASQVTPVPSGWHPETVPISSWAEITDVLPVSEESALTALLPYHVWNARFATERFKWKPRQPLSVLLLRTYRLSTTQLIPYQPEYGGCKSWIDLATSLSPKDAQPVLDQADYTLLAAEIRQICQPVAPV